MSEILGVGVSAIIDDRFPVEYEKHVYQSAQKQAADELMKLLLDKKDSMFTVTLHEKIERVDFDKREYRIVVDVSKVDEIVYKPKILTYEDMGWRILTMTACGEVKSRIKRGIKKLFKVRK